VIEAQAAGLPVVGVAAGAMTERVPAGTGLLGPVDDESAMAANILACWEQGAAAMGARAHAFVAERFTWQRSFEILFDQIYPRAVARRASVLRLRGARGVGLPAPAAGKP